MFLSVDFIKTRAFSFDLFSTLAPAGGLFVSFCYSRFVWFSTTPFCYHADVICDVCARFISNQSWRNISENERSNTLLASGDLSLFLTEGTIFISGFMPLFIEFHKKVIFISIKYAENKRLIHICKANLHKLGMSWSSKVNQIYQITARAGFSDFNNVCCFFTVTRCNISTDKT